MSRFDYHEPTSIAEAVEFAARFGDDARFLAGGTDLMIQIQRGRVAPRHVISLHRVPALSDLAVNGTLVLGACVTHRTIEKRLERAGPLGALVEGAQVIGGHQVRNVATVGGNIVNASPAADLVPGLLALDAGVTLLGPDGERELALEEFLVGPGLTRRRANELLVRVTMPMLPPRSATAFLKAGRRKAMEISVACVAARLALDARNERCVDARITLGAVAPTTVRARRAEASLAGEVASTELFHRAGALAAEECDPISDVRASAKFRRHLVSVLVARALERCVDRIQSSGDEGSIGSR